MAKKINEYGLEEKRKDEKKNYKRENNCRSDVRGKKVSRKENKGEIGERK